MARVKPQYILVSLTVRPPARSQAWFGEIIEAMSPGQRLIVGGIGSRHLPAFQEDFVENMGMYSYVDVINRLMAETESAAS